jgi:hypothetical protein
LALRTRSSPDSRLRRSVSITALTANALPVCRWQSLQWQQLTNIGADPNR